MDNTTKQGRTTAIIAYFTIVGSLIAITMNLEPKNAYARFHIRQAFGIHLFFHALAIVLTFLQIGLVFALLYFVYLLLWGYGCLAAINGKTTQVPVLGNYFQKWFTFIQ